MGLKNFNYLERISVVSVFRRNRSCIEQLYSLHCIIHNCIKFKVLLYINVIDFKAAFDSINRDLIRKAFERYGLPKKYINVFKAFFRATESAVRVNGELTRWFDVDSGTGQSDVQGPPIFNLVLYWGLQLAEKFKKYIARFYSSVQTKFQTTGKMCH